MNKEQVAHELAMSITNCKIAEFSDKPLGLVDSEERIEQIVKIYLNSHRQILQQISQDS